MSHGFAPGASFFASLLQVDDEIADAARVGGCGHCGGPLHRGDYPRKPRGLPEEAELTFARRRSLCCGRCRRRTTPPSVRFLGRKVYVGWLVVVAVMQWIKGADVEGPTVSGVPRRTVGRWKWWWTFVFAVSAFWRATQARFAPPPEPQALPLSLFRRFRGEVATRLRVVLRFVAPITTSSAFGEVRSRSRRRWHLSGGGPTT